jgi:hypothetical protein
MAPLFKFHKKDASRQKREEFKIPLFYQGLGFLVLAII